MPNKELRKAVIELSNKAGKPILKLTRKDYIDYGYSSLLDTYGEYYDVNLAVHNDLQHLVTGWPGGKPGKTEDQPFPKRIIIFSPHPDDDVISMGGTLRRLVRQGHEVHIAYQTSGNIAVNNEEVMRYLLFMRYFSNTFDGLVNPDYIDFADGVKSFVLGSGTPLDNNEYTLKIKTDIRKNEACLACAYNGVKERNIHFLEMPFYESGAVEKLPLSEVDYSIIYSLLDSIHPHQIYMAGDLADPHGTHEKCTSAVLHVLDQFRKEQANWLENCVVWFYRGAWAEYDWSEIDMAVPMSPDELLEKRNAILRHHSQMESAPFMGDDNRLFWQRAEDRNRATADKFDRLGLICYEAIEAFKRG
ncbi:MAG: PIG-L family deacetylase [Paludibacteraceae bacterium]|nr:PIG-L family deacetylase [Paludibacteraceae bacterium]